MARYYKPTPEHYAMMQQHIDCNEPLCIRSENLGFSVNVRYNSDDTDGMRKWRVIVDGNELFVAHIDINVISKTHSYGSPTGIKHSIVCKATMVSVENRNAIISS